MDTMTPPRYFDVSGVIHCHSSYSDGAESVPVIAEAANQAGLDFLMMTDHDTVKPLLEVGEQWYKQTLLLFGYEITPRHNHYLVYGISPLFSPHLPPAEYTAAVAEHGGIGFIAHPFDQGSPRLGQNSYTWEDWSVTDYTGLEIWNYFSEWVGNCRNLVSTVRAVVDWRSATRGPDARALARWDELGRLRRVVGIGGLDAHGVKRRVAGRDIVLHPYKRSFGTVRTHLLLPEPFVHELGVDRQQVMAALRSGSCYVANHEEGNPAGFTFVGRRRGGWLQMGQETGFSGRGEIYFSGGVPQGLGPKPTLRLLKDGQVIAETTDWALQEPDQGPGVYRMEAWKRGRGWVFSNPIYVRE